MTKRLAALFLLFALPLFGQSNTGELRLKIVDPSGAGVQTTVLIVSEANQYRSTLVTDEAGGLNVQRLPYGIYQLQVIRPGFAEVNESIEIRSSLPTDRTIQLRVTPVHASVTVSSADTLINPEQAGYVNQLGLTTIENLPTSLPGRSLQDLVNTQPGWFYEGSGVLHPREAEYQTQFVMDGVPLIDNRSPGFGPVIEAEDIESVTAYTAGFPAEYGRKMGGVVVVNTQENPQPGFHGEVVLSGGSYDSAGAFVRSQYSWGQNTVGATASLATTQHYLNPVVAQNLHNAGNIGDFSSNYQRNFTPNDRLTLIVRHEYARYDIPNELVQQQAGQDEMADNFETMGIIFYEHFFSSNVAADIHGMVRDNSNDFYSNANSTPIFITQHNRFREGYFRGAVSVNHGHHEWKVGVESDNLFLHENFGWAITNYNLGGFDPSTPQTFGFLGTHPDLEQAVFVQDLVHVGNWTVNAGLRWDHYQLLVSQNAVSPRFAISRYLPSAGLILHFSYDRIFQTPSFENLLLSSSSAAAGIASQSIQLPIHPSEGNFSEAGITKQFANRIAVTANYFRRSVNNYADDNPFQDTPIAFPVVFAKAIIYGAEGKLDLPEWKRFSGFLSYSYQLGSAFNPVTGGLFLGVTSLPLTGHFPATQDQRNTVRSRLQYQITPRLWVAGELQFDSGLPFQFECDTTASTLDQCIQAQVQQYGQPVVNRVNFAAGRIYPTTLLGASAGANVYKSDRFKVRFQLDGENLTNVVDVIDFGGLFSGNAIGPGRSFNLRLSTTF